MTDRSRNAVWVWGPPLLSALVVAGLALLGSWVLVNSRVAALEVRVDERKDDVTELRGDVKKVQDKVDEIHKFLLERSR